MGLRKIVIKIDKLTGAGLVIKIPSMDKAKKAKIIVVMSGVV